MKLSKAQANILNAIRQQTLNRKGEVKARFSFTEYDQRTVNALARKKLINWKESIHGDGWAANA